ncbi:hypothetical protein ACWGCW_10010 [Streptomyces sp. NPDC054933]
MRFGVKIGPFYASTSTRRRKRKPEEQSGCLWLIALAILLTPPILFIQGIVHGDGGEIVIGGVFLAAELGIPIAWKKTRP